MSDFAKVQGYAIKSAVIALAFADVATYFVINRHIHEPVVTSEELADAIDKADPDRPASAVMAETGNSLPLPVVSPYEVGNRTPEVAPPTIDSTLAAQGAEVEQASLDAPDRAEPAVAELTRKRAIGPASPAAPRRAGTKAFARAFSSYPVAKVAELASACAEIAADAAGDNCPPAQPDLAADYAEPMQSAAVRDFGQNPPGESPELPALIGEPALPDGGDRTIAEPGPQIWDRGDGAERIAPKPAVTPSLYDPQRQNAPAAAPQTTPTAMDLNANEPAHVAKAIAAEFTRNLPKAAPAVTIAKSASRPASSSIIGTGERQPLAHVPHLAASPATIAPAVMLLAAAGSEMSAQPEQVQRFSHSRAAADGSVGLCLKDILIALRPLMSSDEFEGLMRSRHSAAMVSLATLAEAGISVEYDRASHKVRFS